MSEWRDSYFFPDNYQVSDEGTVRNKISGKYIRPASDKYGYLYYVLCVNGSRKTVKAHRLVALTFIPNPDNKPTVDHINSIRVDNRVTNLRWATNKEQSNFPLTKERLARANKGRDFKAMGMIRDFGRKKTLVIKDGKIIGKFNSQSEASKYVNVSPGKVSQCISGHKKSCKGYEFREVN